MSIDPLQYNSSYKIHIRYGATKSEHPYELEELDFI